MGYGALVAVAREASVKMTANPALWVALLATAMVPAGLAAAPNRASAIFSTIYSFKGGDDGQEPSPELVRGPDGTLFGTTVYGGAANAGTVFELTPPAASGGAWTETQLFAFTGGPDASGPQGLTSDGKGGMLGLAAYGGIQNAACPSGCGVIFRLSPPTPSGGPWTQTVIYSFTGGSDGALPVGSLVPGPLGVLYGAAAAGGNLIVNCRGGGSPAGCGVLFELTPMPARPHAWTYCAIYSFLSGDDGAGPGGYLVLDKSGAIYGTTLFGGPHNVGTVFQLSPAGEGWSETISYSFTGAEDGAYPAALVLDGNGVLYGAAQDGGASNVGTVFALSPPSQPGGAWGFMLLQSFNGRDGSYPLGGLTHTAGGDLAGTTFEGGSAKVQGFGTVFLLKHPAAPGGAWAELLLHRFEDQGDGAYPFGGLLPGKGRLLYGTTSGAGVNNGTVFRLTQ
jgi:uncharacterized repeat protein (TIGR03803 family)